MTQQSGDADLRDVANQSWSNWIAEQLRQLECAAPDQPIGTSNTVSMPVAAPLSWDGPREVAVQLAPPSPRWEIKNALLKRIEHDCTLDVQLAFRERFPDERLKTVRDLRLALRWVEAMFSKESITPSLVTIKQVANLLAHIEPSSMTKYVKDWGEPIVVQSGTRPAKFDIARIRSTLQKQFPHATPDDWRRLESSATPT